MSIDDTIVHSFCVIFTWPPCFSSTFSPNVPREYPQSLSWRWSASVRVASQRRCARWLAQYPRAGVWRWSSRGPGKAWISSARAGRRLNTGSVESEHCRGGWRIWPRKRNLTNILFLFIQNCITVYNIYGEMIVSGLVSPLQRPRRVPTKMPTEYTFYCSKKTEYRHKVCTGRIVSMIKYWF